MHLLGASAIPLALALAGCSSTGSGSSAGSSAGLTPSEAILKAYNPTVAKVGDPTSINDAQRSTEGKGGIEGFGVATAGATSAASTVGTYVVGNVQQIDPDKLKITVGDKDYVLSGGTEHTTGQLGMAYTAYGNTAHSTPTPGEKGGAYLLNTNYASLAIFTKGGDWTAVDDEDDEWTIPNMEGYGMIVTGLQTPKDKMPKQTADYHGEYYYAAVDSDSNGTFGASGSFDMTADFGNNKLTGAARVIGGIGDPDDPDHTKFNGTIKDNQFHGTTTRLTDVGMNGKFAGGFYGPNAEEIAGAGFGKATPEQLGEEVDASMVFIGKKKTP